MQRKKPAKARTEQPSSTKSQVTQLSEKKTEDYLPEKRPHRGVSWQHVPKFLQSGPIAAFSANAEKMHAFGGLHMPSRTRVFDRLPYTMQKSINCPSVHFFLARLRARQTKVLKEKADFLRSRLSNPEWCPRRESNSHVFRQRFLRPPRLPFRHSGAKSNYTRCSRKRKPKFQSTRKKQRCRPRKPSGQERRRQREAPFREEAPKQNTTRSEPNRPETR